MAYLCTFLGAFEGHVFEIVSHSILSFSLKPATRVYPQPHLHRMRACDTHTHTHSHTHTHTHSHIHTRSLSLSPSLPHTYTLSLTHTHTHTGSWRGGKLTVQVLPPLSSEATLSPLFSTVTSVLGTFSKHCRTHTHTRTHTVLVGGGVRMEAVSPAGRRWPH